MDCLEILDYPTELFLVNISAPITCFISEVSLFLCDEYLKSLSNIFFISNYLYFPVYLLAILFLSSLFSLDNLSTYLFKNSFSVLMTFKRLVILESCKSDLTISDVFSALSIVYLNEYVFALKVLNPNLFRESILKLFIK